MRTSSPWLLNAVASRMKLPPEGLGGGAPGAAGRFLVNGKTVSEARKMVMQTDDVVTLETPGGGGYGQPTNFAPVNPADYAELRSQAREADGAGIAGPAQGRR
jgi:N-methylhydantoinase B/oxoprolinase/acetone carboxylase alpha subunit